jgi:hypothetical protein
MKRRVVKLRLAKETILSLDNNLAHVLGVGRPPNTQIAGTCESCETCNSICTVPTCFFTCGTNTITIA